MTQRSARSRSFALASLAVVLSGGLALGVRAQDRRNGDQHNTDQPNSDMPNIDVPKADAANIDAPNIDAQDRVLPAVGPNVQSIRRDAQGRYYVLVAPGPAVLVFDSGGKQTATIPSKPSGASAIVYGEGLDIDPSGRIYVADRGGNAVIVYAGDGSLLARVPVSAPSSVAALPGDEFAVSGIEAPELITVYDLHGALLRQFGALLDLADEPALNRRLNLGRMASDAAGNLYFAFAYAPDPSIRKYDRFGYLIDEVTLTTPDAQPMAQAARRVIARADHGEDVAAREIVSALGVDPASQEMWVALGDLLLHFSADGRELGIGRTYTSAGAHLSPVFILAEPEILLLGGNPSGVYEFPRTGKTVSAR